MRSAPSWRAAVSLARPSASRRRRCRRLGSDWSRRLEVSQRPEVDTIR